MSTHPFFTVALTDYFGSIPLTERQRILDTMKKGISVGLNKTEIKLSLFVYGKPAIPVDVFDDLYEMMMRAAKWNRL